MNKWKRGLLGFFLKGIVICISFLGVFVLTYRLNQDYLRQVAQTVVVVTARADLLPGTPLTRESLVSGDRPVFALGADYAWDIDELLDQGPWYTGDIGFSAGDVIRPSRLLPAAAAGGKWRWEFAWREHVRLIAVETSLVRSGGDWLWPGSVADAFVYLPAKDNYIDPQPSRIIGPEEDPLLGGLLVIDKKSAGGLSLDGQVREEGFSRDLLPAVITLMVDERDTERIEALIRYNEEGKIYFSPKR